MAAPIAVDDEYSTDEDSPFSSTTRGVLANDDDPDGDPLRVVAVRQDPLAVGMTITLGSGALLALNEDGSFTYDPNGRFDHLEPGQQVIDGAVYTVEDSTGARAFASLRITISGRAEPVVGGDGEDTFVVPPLGGQLVEEFFGGPGIDLVSFRDITDPVVVRGNGFARGLGINALTFEAERVEGGQGDDTFLVVRRSRQEVVEFDGGAGTDTVSLRKLPGGAVVEGDGSVSGPRARDLSFDAERVEGSHGDDTLMVVRRGRQEVVEFEGGAGTDTVSLRKLPGGAVVQGDGSVSGPRARDLSFDAEHVEGSPGDDTLVMVGRSRHVVESFDGSGGADRVITRARAPVEMDLAAGTVRQGNVRVELAHVEDATGGGGDDVLRGNAGANRLAGASGDDLLRGRGGDDVLLGLRGRDVLIGGPGDDVIRGGAGNDVLDGGSGNNRLSGGPNADLYRLSGPAGSRGSTIIDDLDPMRDKIDIGDRFDFADLDSDGNGRLNGADAAVSRSPLTVDGTTRASLVIEFGPPGDTLSLFGVTEISSDSFLF